MIKAKEHVKVLLYEAPEIVSPEVKQTLVDAGFFVQVLDFDELLSSITREVPDVVVLHLAKARDEAALAVLQEVKSLEEHLPVFVLSSEAEVAAAVDFMKAGANDFLVSSTKIADLEEKIRRATYVYHLTKRVYQVESKSAPKADFFGIVGQSQRMQQNFKTISQVAKTNATVLIQGESGTGKELVAKAIHVLSGRPKNKLVDINCGAIPRDLLENELFGHERGAFTGAERRYLGSFERASGGTIFLDEIAEMDVSLQVKLLRVLQTRSFTRVGGSEKVEIEVRVIAATNKDLTKEVEEGRFREDLFYRLNVVPISLPPLRERPEDVAILARHFLNHYSLKNDKIFLDFHPVAMEALIHYSWPGNVRELENAIERVVILANDNQVKLKHLPEHFQNAKREARKSVDATSLTDQKIMPLELLEKFAIENALKQCAGNVSESARRLEVGQATLYRKIRKFGISKETE